MQTVSIAPFPENRIWYFMQTVSIGMFEVFSDIVAHIIWTHILR